MRATKTLQQRDKELQSLLATAQGRAELEALADRYYAAGGRLHPEKTSLVTYLLVHERQMGLIQG